MKFLLQNNSISINVARFTVVLKVFLNHFIRYVARTPNTIPNRPKVPTPISLRKFWVLFLQPPRRSTFQAFNNIANVQRWSVFDVDMHVVFAHNAFKYLDILRITNLLHKLTASLLDVTIQNFISIFCNPNYVGRKPRYCVATNSLFFTHKVKLAICVATESLALKAHSFN
jgi:hypothetical protein